MIRSFRARTLTRIVALAFLTPAAASAADSDIRFSSVGFLPSAPKRVSVTAEATTLDVHRASDRSIALTVELSEPRTDLTGVPVRVGDFSALKEPGVYYLSVPGVGRSAEFPVAADVYDSVLDAAMLGFYGWRAGVPIDFTYGGVQYRHAAGHTTPGLLDYYDPERAGETKQSPGGWYDAGDYGRYIVNSAITAGTMLRAYEDFPVLATTPFAHAGGGAGMPAYLAELRYQLEWMLTMQFADGAVSHKLTTLNFGGFVMPDRDTAPLYFAPWGTAATAGFTAVMAQAARVYKTVDAAFALRCENAAKLSFQFLQSHPDPVDPDLSAFKTGGYGTTDPDDRDWAAAEMWASFGNTTALAQIEATLAGSARGVEASWDWSNVRTLGAITYLRSTRAGRNPVVVAAQEERLLSVANSILGEAEKSPYGRGLPAFFWGSNGSVARQCVVLETARRQTGERKYSDACTENLGWLLGRNYFGRSQVTGVGLFPPCHPHDRRSGADGILTPYPGLIVGGGSAITNWVDEQGSYETNEVAINWQAALVYGLAAFATGEPNGSSVGFASPVSDCSVQPPMPPMPPAESVSGPVDLIDNFEDLDVAILPSGGRSGNWYLISDGTGTNNGVSVDAEGRDGKPGALHVQASGVSSWGGGIGTALNGDAGALGPYDVTAYQGLVFWAKAAAPQQVRLSLPNSHTDPMGNECTNCYDHFGYDVQLSTEWTEYRIPWSRLAQAGWGLPTLTEFDRTTVLEVQFRYGTGAGFEFWVDDVGLVWPEGTVVDDGSGGAPATAEGGAGGGSSVSEPSEPPIQTQKGCSCAIPGSVPASPMGYLGLLAVGATLLLRRRR